MKSPIKVKDMQHLTRCVVALNQFVAYATNRCLPLFRSLKNGSDFVWTDDCEQSFQELTLYLERVPLLSKPVNGETLSLYLVVFEAAVSAVLIRKEESQELPMFYISRALLDWETCYLDT